MIEAVKTRVVDDLGKIVGSEFVSTNPADLHLYSQDMTQAEPGWPDVVALPKSVAEIQAVVSLANKEKTTVIPYLAGANVGGLAIPLDGGIILDLKRMNRIIEVNDTDMYAIVEAGATFGHLKAYLTKNHPDLVYTYAFSPPTSGIVTNALLQGLDNLSFRYGAASNWVSGLEVVLPTGELVKIGSCAVSEGWQSLVPLPELAGLFLGWQGTTGIITKMAVSLWPKPKHATQLTFSFMDLEGADKAFKALARTRIPDDIIGTSFALSKINLSAMGHGKASVYPAPPRNPDEPEFIITAEVTGNTENELKAKVEVIEKVAREEFKDIKMTGPQTAPSTTAAFPMQALGVLSGGGGLTWVGTYGPMSKWLETAKKGCEFQDKYNITRSCYTRIMNEGHFAGLRWMLPFDKEDPETVRRIEALCTDQLEMVLDMGYIPYKTPVWAIRKLEEKADPAWIKLLRRVKEMLDPNNILNPGRWGRPQE
jgi:FAD/FMN-containing dehydrogenase